MTAGQARQWLILISLAASGVTLIFCFCAPVFGYPLVWSESLRLAGNVLPIFTAYLGTAAGFAFRAQSPTATKDGYLSSPAQLLVKWPPLICWITIAVLLAAFGFSNRRAAIDGSGMSIQQLALGMSLALSVATTTTGAAVAFLFAASE